MIVKVNVPPAGTERADLTLITDGTKLGTHVIDRATGKRIAGIQHIAWEYGYDELPTITLKIVDVPFVDNADNPPSSL